MKWLDLIPPDELDCLLSPPSVSPISESVGLCSVIEQFFSSSSSGRVPFHWYFVSDSKLPPEIRDLMIEEGTYPALF